MRCGTRVRGPHKKPLFDFFFYERLPLSRAIEKAVQTAEGPGLGTAATELQQSCSRAATAEGPGLGTAATVAATAAEGR